MKRSHGFGEMFNSFPKNVAGEIFLYFCKNYIFVSFVSMIRR